MATARVLVVDDDAAIRSLLADELEENGYKTQCAADGAEAVELIAAKRLEGVIFDIILLDIELPKLNGFEVLQYVKENAPESKVIMVTGYADVGNAIRSMLLGASGFLSKPYDLNEILISIERELKK